MSDIHLWEQVKLVFNTLKSNNYLNRRKLHLACGINPRQYQRGTLVDTYRVVLERAKFVLGCVNQKGYYQLVTPIPVDLTLKKAREIGYSSVHHGDNQARPSNKTTKSFAKGLESQGGT